ncbi:MAG TPA: class I SAM-dependent methyltransferase [Noviherbaspirillum sp.]
MAVAGTHASQEQPSAWVARFASLVPPGEVLDLACGGGRHARLMASLGHAVLAVDCDAEALKRAKGAGISTLQKDLEAADGQSPAWSFEADRFAGIVVTNYLYRPLMKNLMHSLAPGGVLLYETFACGNERYGKPSNPDFLLRPGELIDVVGGIAAGARIIAYEDGYVALPRPAMVQRICARKEGGPLSDIDLRLN